MIIYIVRFGYNFKLRFMIYGGIMVDISIVNGCEWELRTNF
jgi:hypothetical protein